MDKKLFENLFRSYYSVLCRYALRYLHDEQVAEDIVQEYYVDIWENAKLSIIPEQFFSYSCHAIYNRCLNYYKAEATKEAFINRLSEEWDIYLDETENDFLYKTEIRSALRKLPQRSRYIFLLKCVRGMKYKEISEISGISVNTVKYHLGEAFRIMREELRKSIKNNLIIDLPISIFWLYHYCNF